MSATVEGGDPGAGDRARANGDGPVTQGSPVDGTHTDPADTDPADTDAELAELAQRFEVDAVESPAAADAVEFDARHDLTTRVANARARHGRAGGMLAAGMLGLDQAMTGRKPREQPPVVVDANSDPHDIDTDGISVALDDVDVVAPPLPRTPPVQHPGKRRRWR